MAIDPGVLMGEIRKAAAKYGLREEDLVRTAQLESSFGKNVANPNSSARGPFQFINSTWKQYGQGQNVMDVAANTDAAARLMLDNKNALSKRLGRAPEGWELYLAHQQGIGGANKLLGSPDARAVDLVGGKAVSLNGGNAGMAGSDFANIWKAKYNKSKAPPQVGASAATAMSYAPSAGGQSYAPSAVAPSAPAMSTPAMIDVPATNWQALLSRPQGEIKGGEAPSTVDFLAKLQADKPKIGQAVHEAASQRAIELARTPWQYS